MPSAQLTNGQTVAKPPPVADTAAYQGINNVQVGIRARAMCVCWAPSRVR